MVGLLSISTGLLKAFRGMIPKWQMMTPYQNQDAYQSSVIATTTAKIMRALITKLLRQWIKFVEVNNRG